MYKSIYVPVDNSEYSQSSCHLALLLAKKFKSSITGCHVYAAKMHEYRFKQMEYTLPEEYQEENELERQRKIHDSLITMGLKLISDSYMEMLGGLCQKENVPFERKMFDGRTFQPLVEDIQNSQYDLVIMGVLGMGVVKDSVLGSVTERVVRRMRKGDLIVVKDLRPLQEQTGNILVGIDGSPQSYAGLKSALELGRTMGRTVEAVAVYDPYLHYSMFNSISQVLTEKAAKVFKIKEQEKLHEEIIDTGLAKIYQSHLEVAREVAKEEGVDLKITLLDGKAFEKVILYIRKTKPWMLVLGRIGVHSKDDMDIGSNAENLLRLAPCHVLMTSRKYHPAIDVRAEAAVMWSPEAEARMERVPVFVKGIARTAVLRYALERGHSVVTNSVVEEVMSIFMPQKTAEKAQNLAEAIAAAQVADGSVTYICSSCGYVNRKVEPVRCPVCSAEGKKFQKLDREVLSALASQEGTTKEEKTFDGVVLKWTLEAVEELGKVPPGIIRRRTKARIEKTARVRKLTVVSRELSASLAQEAIDDEAFVNAEVARTAQMSDKNNQKTVSQNESEKNVVAYRDASSVGETNGSPMIWDPDALARLERAPKGFMRDMSRKRIEEYAASKRVKKITLQVAEEGLVFARQIMQEMITGYSNNTDAVRRAAASQVKPSLKDSESDPPLSEAVPVANFESKYQKLS